MRLGMGEIILLLVLALVLFGPKRLPEVGRAAGKAIREFKSAINGIDLKGTEADVNVNANKASTGEGEDRTNHV